MTKRRLTQQEYDQACIRSRQSERVQRMAYERLVLGRAEADIALEHDVTIQAVGRGVRDFYDHAKNPKQAIDADLFDAAMESSWMAPEAIAQARQCLVDGLTPKAVATSSKQSLSKILSFIRAAKRRLASYQAGQTEPRRGRGKARPPLPRLVQSMQTLQHFHDFQPGRHLSDASLKVIQLYHIEGKTMHEIAGLCDKRTSDIYATLHTFSRLWEAYQDDQERQGRHVTRSFWQELDRAKRGG